VLPCLLWMNFVSVCATIKGNAGPIELHQSLTDLPSLLNPSAVPKWGRKPDVGLSHSGSNFNLLRWAKWGRTGQLLSNLKKGVSIWRKN